MGRNEELAQAGARCLATTYARFPIALVRGEGARVWDADGREYLDFVGGIAVTALGHCHPRVTAALRAQAGTLLHVSNLYHIEPQIRLAQLLTKHSFADRAFFCNSGAEANEAAIKLARKHAKDRWSTDRYEILCMRDSFHGRTLAAVTATGQEKYHHGFEPLVPGFKHVPFNDLKAVERALDSRTCAVLVEPVQGEGGVRVPDAGYLAGLRRLCDEAGALLILDEVQVGMGRTGTLFAYEGSGIEPDILTLAKALANGVPIGALLATERVAASFTPGTHAATFGGNPLATAAAVAVMETMLEERIPERAGRMGTYLRERLEALRARHARIRQVRGLGLLVGVEIEGSAREVVQRCMARGLLALTAGDTVVRFTPPLIIGEAEVDRAVTVLDEALGEMPA